MRHSSLLAASLLLVVGCGSDSGGDDDVSPPLGGARTVRGSVVDFVTGMPVEGATSVSVSGLQPAPRITVQGATYEIADVPENSTFHILAASPPAHRATFSPAVVVERADVNDVKSYAVSEAVLSDLAMAFGVQPAAGRGVLLAQVTGMDGQPRAGVAGTSLVVQGGAKVVGPYFLDDQREPAPQLTATSASGWAVWFEIEPGLTSMAPAAGSGLTVDMPVSPVAAGAVTIVSVVVIDGAPPGPQNVSFANDVFPIFEQRGCVACHSGNGIGRDLGNLTLDGSTNLVYKELIEEPRAVLRVNVASPEASLVLTMPSREDPADSHPNVTFASAADPDYLILLAWIKEGAKEN
jgi:hypothetical protein